ncbi:unnamed protein product [Owenia fusiformis]|uniref:La-related protein 7 n=1 Tax=Owenia fusiformis TaxID=6347 RepID=A0A8S4PLK7_OWEFU|nr:unnamed protein product [Owenia fusiformis]
MRSRKAGFFGSSKNVFCADFTFCEREKMDKEDEDVFTKNDAKIEPAKDNIAAPTEKKKRKRMKELYKQILKQMEFYFGDANLRRDRFIKKEIDKSVDGYVPLEMFLTFNKIKALTDSSKVLAKALAPSTLIQLSEDGTRIKRTKELASESDCDARTVYVECLPIKVDHEWVKSTFNVCGEIAYVSLPRFKSTGDIKGFAFIEFTTKEGAEKAVQQLNNPPVSAGEKLGHFPKYNKQLISLQKSLSTNDGTVPENTQSEKCTTDKVTCKKRRRRRQTSECSVDDQEATPEKKTCTKSNDITTETDEITTKNDDVTQTQKIAKIEETEQLKDNEPPRKRKRKRTRSVNIPVCPEPIQTDSSEPTTPKRKSSKEDEERLTPIISTSTSATPKRKRKPENTELTSATPSDSKKVRIVEPHETEPASKSEKENMEGVTSEKTNTEVVKSKRKRKKKKQNKQQKHKKSLKEVPELRVIPKQKWLNLKQEYLDQQKLSMSKLKRTLNEFKAKTSPGANENNEKAKDKKMEFIPDVCNSQSANENNEKAKDKKMGVQPDVCNSQSANENNEKAKDKKMEFIADVVVRVKSEQPLDKKKLKSVLCNAGDVAYIDLLDGNKEGHIRYKEASGVETLVATPPLDCTISRISGEEEKNYWDKLIAQRDAKLNSKTRDKKRGKHKVIRQAERLIQEVSKREHIIFT